MLIKWNGLSIWSIGKEKKGIVSFVPGANQIKESDWNAIKENAEVKARMEKKVYSKIDNEMVPMLQVIEKDKKLIKENEDKNSEGGDDKDVDTSAKDLSEVNVKVAVKMVKETYNTPLLREWLEKETRGTVAAAIEKQLQKIDEERSGDGEGDE